MLYSVVLNLIAKEHAELSSTQGYHSYALFLSLLQGVAPEVSKQLHDVDGTKPFTISPLRGRFIARGRKVSAKRTFWLRFTFLDDSLFPHLAHALLKHGNDRELRLGPAAFKLEEIVTHPQGSPWAAFDRFEDIHEHASLDRKVTLEFSSPTAFRSSGKRNFAFPLPDLVFGSYLTRWNAHSPIKFDERLRDYLSENIIPARYNIETRILDFGSYQEVGFEGICTFIISESVPQDVVQQLNALADFAFYAGTGAKTTMGMGQTRRINYARSLPNRARGNPEKRW